MKSNRKNKQKKIGFSKAILKRLDKNNKETQLLFKRDKVLLRELRKIINEQKRKTRQQAALNA